MKYLFFLTIFLIPFLYASADEGPNYINQQNPDGTITAAILPYERILINGQWKNYDFYQDASTISFESGSASFKLDKTTCDFQLYEKGQITKSPIIGNYIMEYYIDTVKVLPICNISPITEDENNISFKTEFNGITRTFILGVNGIEWISDTIDIPDGKDTTLKIVETCEACVPDRIEGD